MNDLGVVLKETWRRYWPSPSLWAVPMLLIVVFIVGFVLLTLMFFRLGGAGILLLMLGFLAYAGMVLAGLSGAWAAAVRRGRALFDDFLRGIKPYFWRMVGLFGLYLVVSLLIGLIVGALAGTFAVARYGITGPGFNARSYALSQAVGYLVATGAVLLFGFVPAAVVFGNLPTMRGWERALGFVGRRFWLCLALVLIGGVLTQAPAVALVTPFFPRVSALTPGLAAGTVDPIALFGLLGKMLAVSFLYMIYNCFVMPFVALSFFVAYGRDAGQLDAVAASGGVAGTGSTAGAAPDASGQGPGAAPPAPPSTTAPPPHA